MGKRLHTRPSHLLLSKAQEEVIGGDQFQVLESKPVQRWHLLSRGPRQDCLSNGSNGQTKQDLAMQHHPGALQASSSSTSLLSPPSSSVAVKHGPCWLTLKKKKKGDPGFQTQEHEETSPYLLLRAQDQRLGAEQDQLHGGFTRFSSVNWQQTETCMVRTCHTPRQPLQNHPPGYLGGWATPWSAEEMLDGQHQRVDTSAPARAAHKRLLKKRLDEDLC